MSEQEFQIYHGDMGMDSEADVFDMFRCTDEQKAGVRIHWAEYWDTDYSGTSTVIFERGGHLFEVHGSHCSCHGLENQWEPELSTAQDLANRVDRMRAAAAQAVPGTWASHSTIVHRNEDGPAFDALLVRLKGMGL